MKNYTILVLIVIMAFNACKKKSHNTTSEKIAAEPASSELVSSEPTLDAYSIGEKLVWLEKSVAEGKIRWEGKELQEVVAFKGSLGFWNGKDTILISNTLNQEQSSTAIYSWGTRWNIVPYCQGTREH